MAGRTPKLLWNLQDTEGVASLRHPHLNLIDKHYWARLIPANTKGFCCVLTTLHGDHLPFYGHHHGVWAQSVQVGTTHVGGAVFHYLLQVYGRIQLEPGQQIHSFTCSATYECETGSGLAGGGGLLTFSGWPVKPATDSQAPRWVQRRPTYPTWRTHSFTQVCKSDNQTDRQTDRGGASPARSQQWLVKQVWTICGSNDKNTNRWAQSVKFSQQLRYNPKNSPTQPLLGPTNTSSPVQQTLTCPSHLQSLQSPPCWEPENPVHQRRWYRELLHVLWKTLHVCTHRLG